MRGALLLRLFGASLMAAGTLGALPVAAQHEPTSRDWPKVKCDNYRSAWNFTLSRRSKNGLGEEFLARHTAFIASGCTTPADVCPRSPEELDLANVMVILAMNAGMASTFPPFACRKQ